MREWILRQCSHARKVFKVQLYQEKCTHATFMYFEYPESWIQIGCSMRVVDTICMNSSWVQETMVKLCKVSGYVRLRGRIKLELFNNIHHGQWCVISIIGKEGDKDLSIIQDICIIMQSQCISNTRLLHPLPLLSAQPLKYQMLAYKVVMCYKSYKSYPFMKLDKVYFIFLFSQNFLKTTI